MVHGKCLPLDPQGHEAGSLTEQRMFGFNLLILIEKNHRYTTERRRNMTYEAFIAYLKQKVHDELGYDYSMIKLYQEGYTTTDPAMLEWIRNCNRTYTGREGDMLLTDFLVLKKNADEEITNMQRIAVKQLYNASDDSCADAAFEQIKAVRNRFQDSAINYAAIHERTGEHYDNIKSSLIVRPLNYDLHKAELEGGVYNIIGDVALVLYQLLGDAEHTLTSSKIHANEIQTWGMSAKTDEVLQEALENTAKLFPACVFDKRVQKEVDLLTSDCTRDDITILEHQILMTTFKTTNGATSLFYPGVIEKLMLIMGGAFTVVFMNINDVMLFYLNSQLAKAYAKTAAESSPLGEMLSDKCYRCDENGITVMT